MDRVQASKTDAGRAFKTTGIVDQLKTYGQLIFQWSDFAPRAVELLARHPSESPEVFLPYLTLGDHLDLVKRQLEVAAVAFHDAGLVAAINVDNNLLVNKKAADALHAMLESAAAPVTVEITEHGKLPEPGRTNRCFNHLRTLGHKLALDDFGTGYNGLGTFTEYDFDIIKIDRSLVTGIHTNEKKFEALQLISSLISLQGRDVVVEGIETLGELRGVQKIEGVASQGFLLHKPEPIESVIAAIREKKHTSNATATGSER